jgi:flavin reductase (DIM6/NTAB) family NADH-FMN oxidoreductase RutF
MTSSHELPADFPDVGRREFDPTEQAMHELPYGIYVVGTVEVGDDGVERPNGMIADWVMQVSFEPRLVAVAFENDSSSLRRIRANGAFTVNLLTADQDGLELARGFVQPSDGAKVKGRSAEAAAQHHDKLAGVDCTMTEAGCPLLDDALAWLSCEAQEFVPSGDHTLVVGRVIEGAVPGEGDPMTSTFTGWTYSG